MANAFQFAVMEATCNLPISFLLITEKAIQLILSLLLMKIYVITTSSAPRNLFSGTGNFRFKKNRLFSEYHHFHPMAYTYVLRIVPHSASFMYKYARIFLIESLVKVTDCMCCIWSPGNKYESCISFN